MKDHPGYKSCPEPVSYEEVRLNSVPHGYMTLFREWRNDPDIMQRTRQWKMLSKEDQEAWFENVVCDSSKYPEHLMYAVEIREEQEHVKQKLRMLGQEHNPMAIEASERFHWFPVGCFGLTYIDYIARSSEVSFYIGPPSCRGRGIGLAAMKLLKKLAFETMNLNILWSEVFDFADEIQRFLRRNDFISVGMKPNTGFRNGEYHDSVFFQFTKEMWKIETDSC